MKNYRVVSIDAWGNSEDGYEWNQWFEVGNIDIDVNAPSETILAAMHQAGYITQTEGGEVEDDGFNLVIKDKKTQEPLFAIEYGNA